MEHAEIDFQANEAEIASRPQRLRWVLWGVVIFCAVMIGLVVLSQTRIAARAQSDPSRLSGLISAPNASTGLIAAFAHAVETADSTAPGSGRTSADRPEASTRVSAMPTSRVPVRRAGIFAGN